MWRKWISQIGNGTTCGSLVCDNPDKWPSSSVSSDKNHIGLLLPLPVCGLPYHGHLAKASLFPCSHFITVLSPLRRCNATEALQFHSPDRRLSSVNRVSDWVWASGTRSYEPGIVFLPRAKGTHLDRQSHREEGRNVQYMGWVCKILSQRTHHKTSQEKKAQKHNIVGKTDLPILKYIHIYKYTDIFTYIPTVYIPIYL